MAGIVDLFSTKQNGRATYYDIGSSGGGQGLCTLNSGGQGVGPIPALRASDIWTSGAFNDVDLYGSDACGLCVEVRGKGTGSGLDPVPTTPKVMIITDSCPLADNPKCTQGHIDIEWPTNRNYDGLWDIEWRAVACPSSIGKLEYAFQGSHKWYIKLQVRNHRVPIKKVTITINGRSKTPARSSDNYFIWNYGDETGQAISGAIALRMEAFDGQVITDSFTVALTDRNQNIGPIPSQKQFGAWQGSSAPPLSGGTSPTPSRSKSPAAASASASRTRTPTPSRSRAAGTSASRTPTPTRSRSRTPAAGTGTTYPNTAGPLSNVLNLYQYTLTGGQGWVDSATGPGSCGIANSPPPIANGVWSKVGVSPQNFFGGQACGTCLQVTGADSVPRTVLVTEICDGCPGNTMIFRGGLTGTKTVSWRAVDCPNISGQSLMYQSIGGTNEWWVNFRVLNHRVPVRSVTFLNLFGRARTPATYSQYNDNTWVLQELGQSLMAVTTLSVEVCSVTGQCVTDSMSRSNLLSKNRFSGSKQFNPAKELEAMMDADELVQFEAITLDSVPASGPLSSGLPNYFGDFRPRPSASTYSIDRSSLRLNSNDELLITYVGSQTQLNERLAREKLRVQATSGTLGFGQRIGQSASRAQDRLEWRFVDINGKQATLQWCAIRQGQESCQKQGRFAFPSADAGLDVTILMDLNDEGSAIVTRILWKDGHSKFSNTQTVNRKDWKAIGGLSFYAKGASGAVLSDIRLATTEVMTVSLSECVDDSQWQNVFFGLTGLNREETTVEIQSGSNERCKSGGHTAKELVSAMTFAVTSVSQGGTVAAQTFFSAANSATGSAAGIGSTGVVSGAAASTAAGFPAAGASGGGAAGLSGGAIAGIVIGSVAGGVILIGVSALVIGAVVIGAVVLSRKDDEHHETHAGPSEVEVPSARNSLRQRISRLFGGVNVMNPTPGVHQSITARSPPVRV